MIKLGRITSILLLAFACAAFSGKKDTYGDVVVDEMVFIYDGDTFKANIKGRPPIIGDEISIRLSGIDTPEKRDDDAHTMKKAEKARKYLANRLRNAEVVVLKNIRRDKYFRLLADVYVDRWSMGKEMIRVGLAKEYLGGKRPSW
ncbi:MAG: thermonuclease family protein [Chitinivibrionales bacterium]|nr:thermonuclease family protein [Chitinivibrionales bacterium]